MIPGSIKLRRKPGSLLDVLPISEVALAYMQSVEGVGYVNIAESNESEVILDFVWFGEGDPVIPEAHLDRYGLSMAATVE